MMTMSTSTIMSMASIAATMTMTSMTTITTTMTTTMMTTTSTSIITSMASIAAAAIIIMTTMPTRSSPAGAKRPPTSTAARIWTVPWKSWTAALTA